MIKDGELGFMSGEQEKKRIPPVDTRFKPGQSGNPSGRPSGPTITKELRSIVGATSASVTITMPDGSKKTLELETDKPIKYALALSLVAKALGGDVKAMQEVLNRVDGKAPETILNLNKNVDGLSDEELRETLINALRKGAVAGIEVLPGPDGQTDAGDDGSVDSGSNG